MQVVVEQLYRYPVKTLQGEAMAATSIDTHGMSGDRCWAICRASDGQPIAAKDYPWLMQWRGEYLSEPKPGQRSEVRITGPNLESLVSTDPDCDAKLSQHFKEPVTLVYQAPRGFFFDTSIHVLSTNTLASFRSHQQSFADRGASDFDPRRYRPNILIRVEGLDSPFPEHSWLSKTLVSPELTLDMVRPTDRCGMTTYPFADLPSDPKSLRGVVEVADGVAGVYADVVRGGVSRCGDLLVLR